MSIGGHLREFRNRTLVALAAILVGCIVGWHYYQEVYDFLRQPISDIAATHPHSNIDINFDGVTAPFNLKFKVVLWIGFILASPVWIWEIWAFLVPGLTKRERRVGRIFIVAALVLFSAGVYMGSLTYKHAVELFLGATPEHAANLPKASDYFSFVTRFILSFGLIFLVPILLMGLNAVGMLKGRMMLKGWRVAVILSVTFAAIMTPTPDVWTMFIMAAPLLILFFGSAALSLLLDNWRERRDQKQRPEWMDVSDDTASAL